MNFMKKFLVGGTRGGLRDSRGVEVLSLLVFDLFAGLWGLTNLFCSSIESAGRLLQGFY